MIIIINGPFGVGKTAVANELLKRMPNSMRYDPEEVGFMLRNLIPACVREPSENTDDFQDLELWRILTTQVAEEIVRKYRKTLIVPMTLWKRDYFDFIFNRFTQVATTFHFCLLAKKETVHQRLIERGDAVGSWPFLQTDKCLRSFSGFDFGEYIDTERTDISGVCEIILNSIIKRRQ